jgi:predicted transcriptional regulator
MIWARLGNQGTSVRDIFEVLYERRRTAHTIVMNTMTRLFKIHLLRVEKIEQAYVYYPNVTHQEFVSCFVVHILEDLLVNIT